MESLFELKYLKLKDFELKKKIISKCGKVDKNVVKFPLELL